MNKSNIIGTGIIILLTLSIIGFLIIPDLFYEKVAPEIEKITKEQNQVSEEQNKLSPELQELSDENRKRLTRGCLTGKDCIPSIDDPEFLTISEVDYLEPDDLVLSLNYQDQARAYPIKIMNYHEIVNDFVNEKPVLITFCPLCFSGVAYEREIDGEPVEFGVSGKLLNSNLVMYDRKTESYWEQISGEAIVGPLTGEKLQFINIWTIPYQEFINENPDGIVLSNETGFQRNYDVFPYGDYNENNERVMFPLENKDDRLATKELIYGVFVDDFRKAYPIELLNERFPDGGEFIDEIGDREVQISYDGNNRFRAINPETGEEYDHQIGFYFSWAAFFPETELYQ
ncbi:DUF3179 domain-containing protein [Candidatus Peregrinibacteria bacterium]|nr:DUF3179 domain-containing protein [Candidatus Peregrinibacteria bacterium]